MCFLVEKWSKLLYTTGQRRCKQWWPVRLISLPKSGVLYIMVAVIAGWFVVLVVSASVTVGFLLVFTSK